jgi:hypothetical protein
MKFYDSPHIPLTQYGVETSPTNTGFCRDNSRRQPEQSAAHYTSIRELAVWMRSFVVFSIVDSSHYNTLKYTAASSPTNYSFYYLFYSYVVTRAADILLLNNLHRAH